MVVSSNHLLRGALLQPSYHMSAKVLNEELRYEGQRDNFADKLTLECQIKQTQYRLDAHYRVVFNFDVISVYIINELDIIDVVKQILSFLFEHRLASCSSDTLLWLEQV